MTDGPGYPQYPGEQPVDATQPTIPPPPGYTSPPPGYPTAHGIQPARADHASWGARVGASLLDVVFAVCVLAPFVVIGVVVLGISSTASTGPDGEIVFTSQNPVGFVFIMVGYVGYVAFAIWNLVIRQGNTGQSYGKSIVGIRVVRVGGEPRLGKGLALGRMLLSGILTSITCYLNLLWPLWDARKQTLHDKVVSTIVLRA